MPAKSTPDSLVRQARLLWEKHGMPYRKIAKKLNKPPTTVWDWITYKTRRELNP